jgi:hypothetical protein
MRTSPGAPKFQLATAFIIESFLVMPEGSALPHPHPYLRLRNATEKQPPAHAS